MRVPVSNMAEDRDRHMLPFEEVFEIPDQLADPLSRHDDIVDEIDGLLLRVKSIERRIQCLSCLPELLPTLRIKRERRFRRQLVGPTDGTEGVGSLTKVDLQRIGVELKQQRGCRIGRNAMRSSADQVERIGVHDLQGTWLERQDSRHGFADFFQASEVNERGQHGCGFVHQREGRFTHNAQRSFATDE